MLSLATSRNATRRVHVKYAGFTRYIGRPFPGYRDDGWGNPFRVGPDGTREEVVRKFEVWFRAQPGLVARARLELAGEVLGCWCRSYEKCHGDIYIAACDLDPRTWEAVWFAA